MCDCKETKINDEEIMELIQGETIQGSCKDICDKCVYEDLIFVDTSDVEDGALDIGKFDDGTDDACWYIGFYSACINAGMDIEATFTAMQMEYNKQLLKIQGAQDLELAKYQDHKQQVAQL